MEETKIPLNIMKEKVSYCLPENTEIDDDSIRLLTNTVNLFYKDLANSIIIDKENNKIKIKDIKICLEKESKFYFLQKLIEK